ncbi:MAG: MFS transporter [Bythopirellula sp.]|nr:MFS transporter [Bythopirellula sp.]
MAAAEKKLSLGEKLGYGLGDAAANFVLQMQLAFLMHFYTDVYGISALVVGVILATSHIVNACNDLVMGALSDRTQTRWGKFRPWIFWSAIPLGVASYLVFAAPDLGSTGRIVYAVITLNLMIIAFGANNIPYSALGGVISDDPDERVSVASWRMSFAMLAALFVLTFTRDMVRYFGAGDAVHGYRVTMALWASLAVLGSFITFFATKERIVTAPVKHVSLRQDLAALFANVAWRVLAIASLVIYISLGIRGSLTLYYFQYVLAREDLFGAFNAIGMVAAIIGIYSSKSLTERFGKRNAFCGGLVIAAALSAAFYMLRGDQPWVILGLQFVFQVAFGATIPILWGMIADVADFSEWRSGRRITALTFAATLFFFKIGQGIGTALTASLLEVVGYQPNVEQTEAATQGIRLMMSILPASLFFLGGVAILQYVITQPMEREMTATLRERREELRLVGE